MTQNNVNYSEDMSGAELLDDFITKSQENVLTSNSGLQRPSYAKEGTVWLDKTSSPWLYKMFDGTDDIIIGKFDADNNRFIPSDPMTTAGDLIVEGTDGNPIRLAPGTAGTVLTSNGAGALPTYQVNPIGVLTYSSSYTYKKKDIVVNTNEDDETALYKSLVDSNIGNALTDDTKWEKLSLGGGGNDNIGDIQYTTRTEVPEGGAWCDGSEYTQAMFPDIYQMLVDGKIQSTTYATFNSTISSKGSCGFFALDTANKKFKVPLLKDVYLKAGQTPLMFGAESLPRFNGTVNINDNYSRGSFDTPTGHMTLENGGQHRISNTIPGSPNGYRTMRVDLAKASSAYQDGAKVNPDHVVYRAYVILYASAAEASEAQAAEFINALTTKVNTDLNNITAAGKKSVVDWVMPDYSAGVVKTVNVEHTAETAGLITGKGNNYLNNEGILTINGIQYHQSVAGPIYGNSFTLSFFVDEGDVYKLNFGELVFYPLKGVNYTPPIRGGGGGDSDEPDPN